MADSFKQLMEAGSVPLNAVAGKKSRDGGGDGTAGDAEILPPFSEYDGSDEDCPDNFLQNGVAERELKRLRKSAPEAAVDLHGQTRAQAHFTLNRFLANAIAQNRRVVEVVHGRGLHSTDIGVLKIQTRWWLANSRWVLAYAQPSQQNSGAVLVLLRQGRGKKMSIYK